MFTPRLLVGSVFLIFLAFCVLLFALLSLFCVLYPELHVSMVYTPQVATQDCDHGIRNGHVTCSIV